VARRVEAEMRGWPALAEVGAVGSATERHLIRTGEVCVGYRPERSLSWRSPRLAA
jgi:hypothetical protein